MHIGEKYKEQISSEKMISILRKDFRTIIGKDVFDSLLKRCYSKKTNGKKYDVNLFLMHADLHGNLLGTADRYYLIDFEMAGYYGIEYEMALFKYLDVHHSFDAMIRFYRKRFKIHDEKIDLYAIGFLNSKLAVKNYYPISNIMKLVYLFRLMKILFRYKRFRYRRENNR
ncbi:MAG: hypothetical protein GY850_21010 [bacterium]|nr:hypothetical protein [bacterium]